MIGKHMLALAALALAAAYFLAPTAEPRSATVHPVPVHMDRPAQATPIPTFAPEIIPDLAVSGVVVDGDSSPQVPVPGARIIVYSRQGRCDWSVETQSSGRFERHCYDVGRRADVEVRVLPGYRLWPWASTYDLGSTDISGGVLRVRAELKRIVIDPSRTPTPFAADDLHNVFVSGTVLDGGSARQWPVTGARVSVTAEAGFCISPVFSDESGIYEVLCPRANYIAPVWVTINADGFLPWQQGCQASHACSGYGGDARLERAGTPSSPPPTSTTLPGTATPTIVPTPTEIGDRIDHLDISGEVLDAGSANLTPVRDARVFVYARPGRCDWSVLTVSAGRFARACADANWRGEAEIHVVGPGNRQYEPWVRRIPLGGPGVGAGPIRLRVALERIAASEPTPPVDDMRYVRMVGRILNGSRAELPPISSARISAVASPGSCLSPVASAGDGTYEILCPTANLIGVITLAVTAAGYQPWERTMSGLMAGGEQDIVLYPLGVPTAPSRTATASATAQPTSVPTATPSPTPTQPWPPNRVLLPMAWRSG